uniref:Tc3 transposase DNA binding domain-containing protein n=1 Tax=Oncorhynchus mykiss TaxID=8022 RepID=A0A8K9V5D7_ONCMY
MLTGQDNDLSAFEWGYVGARRTGLGASRTATLLGFSHSTVSRVYQRRSTTQKTPKQRWEALESTWASIPVEHFQPKHRRCSEVKKGCNSILGRCS